MPSISHHPCNFYLGVEEGSNPVLLLELLESLVILGVYWRKRLEVYRNAGGSNDKTTIDDHLYVAELSEKAH